MKPGITGSELTGERKMDQKGRASLGVSIPEVRGKMGNDREKRTSVR